MRIEKTIKRYGYTQKDLAKKMGLSLAGLRARFKNPTVESLKHIADNVGCEIHEFFDTSENYAHFYDNGEWLGIRKK